MSADFEFDSRDNGQERKNSSPWKESLDFREELLLTDALRTAELVDPPASLAAGVLSRLEIDPAPALYPSFHLAWIDIALTFFFAGMIGVVFLVSLALPASLSGYLRLEIIYRWQLLWLDPLPVVMVAGSLLLVCTLIIMIGSIGKIIPNRQ